MIKVFYDDQQNLETARHREMGEVKQKIGIIIMEASAIE